MKPLFKRLWHEFWYHEDKARLWLRSAILGLATMFGVVISSASDATGNVNVEIIRSWGWQAWIIRLIPPGLAAIVGGIGSSAKEAKP